LTPSLPDSLWLTGWNGWLQIAKAILSPDCNDNTDDSLFSVVSNSDAEITIMPTVKYTHIVFK
jgi:hypothetical protein